MDLVLWMVFEALSPRKEDVVESLKDHVEMLEEEEKVEVMETDFDDVDEMENPHPDLDKGYSQVVETRIKVDGFDKAVQIAISYGPTYIQLEEPDRFEIDLKEGQNALQEVVNTMHQYAQSGAGGIMISRASQDQN